MKTIIVLLATMLFAIPANAELLTDGPQSYDSLNIPNILGTCSLLDYDPSFPNEGITTQGTSFQNWLLSCQRQAINFGAANKANLILPACVEARTTGLSEFGFGFNTPFVLPRYVCWGGNVTIIRTGAAGTPIANWNGDTTTRQLSNLYQPMLIMPPNGEITAS